MASCYHIHFGCNFIYTWYLGSAWDSLKHSHIDIPTESEPEAFMSLNKRFCTNSQNTAFNFVNYSENGLTIMLSADTILTRQWHNCAQKRTGLKINTNQGILQQLQ